MPHVASLHIHPVKALRAVDVEAAWLGTIGFDGDRRWMVVTPEGQALTQRQHPAMTRIVALPMSEDGLLLRSDGEELTVARPDGHERLRVTLWSDTLDLACAGPRADAFLSEAVGVRSRLVYQDRPQDRPVDPRHAGAADRVSLADGFPILVASAASLAALNAALDRPVEMARFRPNIVIDGAGLAPWIETGWTGLRIGDVTLRTPKPCTRCSVITVDPRSGTIDYPPALLRTLIALQDAGKAVWFGQNAIPDGPGRLAIGDAVTLL